MYSKERQISPNVFDWSIFVKSVLTILITVLFSLLFPLSQAQSLSDVLKCMVNGGLPEKCYTPPIDLPSTETPSTTTIEGSGHEGSGEEGSGEGSGEEGSGKGNEGGGLVIIDGDIDLMSDMLLT